VAALSDLLLLALRGLAATAKIARNLGQPDLSTDRFLAKALNATIANVNFDPESLSALIEEAAKIRAQLRDKLTPPTAVAKTSTRPVIPTLARQSRRLGLVEKRPLSGFMSPQAQSLRETALYGLEGLAAYAYQAHKLGYEDDSLYSFLEQILDQSRDDSLNSEDWLNLTFQVGEKNLLALELLDTAHTQAFGAPCPTQVSLGHRKGPAILISGHDLNDLGHLIPQAQAMGVNIYTHGEMLTAHGYPALQPGLAGHYGSAWPNQTKELAKFPGPIVFTSDCIQRPADSYKERVFTVSPVGWPGVKKIETGPDGYLVYGPALTMAQDKGGYLRDKSGESITVGWGWSAFLGEIDKIKNLVKEGRIRRFILVGGCDGPRTERSYFRELVAMSPPDTLIMTLGCGKFRFIDLDLGDIDGLPRLFDLGQCNDVFSAIMIVMSLAEEFDASVNNLPLSLVLSWHNQKACAILLSLLSLGIKNIRLGPSSPAFMHHDILEYLFEGRDIALTTSPQADLQAMLNH
jgi:hydroxylamine reductase